MYSRISGTGRYLPERILTNAELEGMVDTTDEWIRTRTGIQQRHIAAEGEYTSDLAVHAARRAIEDAGLKPADIDLIIVGTTTPDLVFPNVACLVQNKLGIPPVPAFSVEAACSGFLYALGVADLFVRAGQAQRALVIGAETMSRIVDWSDRETCVLFGDGAGAVVLEASDTAGILYSNLGADGSQWELLYAASGVSRKATTDDFGLLRMKGNEVFRFAVKALERMVDEVVAENDLEKGSIDW
ncbi:MAG: beta-ketoacyl-ACP synthase III, partial [Gammaproteobacteria bacterium]